MKTLIIAGIIAGLACLLFAMWRWQEVSKPQYQEDIVSQIEAQASILHREHPDWSNHQIAAEIAGDRLRGSFLGVLVTGLITMVLYSFVFWLFGDHWWYLTVAFCPLDWGVIGIVLF